MCDRKGLCSLDKLQRCYLRKAKRSVKSLVVKPISSTRFRPDVKLIWLISGTYQRHTTWLIVVFPEMVVPVSGPFYKISHASTSQTHVSCRSCKCSGKDFLWPRSSSHPRVKQWRRIQHQHAILPTIPDMALYQNNSRKASTTRESRLCRMSKQRGKESLASKMRDTSNDLCWV